MYNYTIREGSLEEKTKEGAAKSTATGRLKAAGRPTLYSRRTTDEHRTADKSQAPDIRRLPEILRHLSREESVGVRRAPNVRTVLIYRTSDPHQSSGTCLCTATGL